MDKPIGVFDSGIGGLTVLNEIRKTLPEKNILYLGDTARVPYGSRSKEIVTTYTEEGVRYLISKNVNTIVLACNTASAFALDELSKKYPEIKIFGVIKPGAKTALNNSKNKNIGIIGTLGTVNSNAYPEAIKSIDSKAKIFSKACPLFVPIAEEGWQKTKIAYLTAKKYLKYFDDTDIDSLILGCTHYPVFYDLISDIMGPKIKLINPALETAKELRIYLENIGQRDKKTKNLGKISYKVTDSPERFKKVGDLLINEKINNIEQIEI